MEPPREIVYRIKNVSCSKCALSIEKGLEELPFVECASIDPIQQQMRITSSTAIDPDLLKKIESTVHGINSQAILESDKPDEEGHSAADRAKRKEIIIITASIVLLIGGIVVGGRTPLGIGLILLGFLVSGAEIILDALKNVFRGNWFEENFLMSLGSVGAIAIGEYPEGATVMILYRLGELLQNSALDHSRRSITSLMELKPESAELLRDGQVVTVDPAAVAVGDLILVKPGQRVPLDGTVMEGASELDTSALTGESLPRSVQPGSEVLAGSINCGGLLTLRVTRLVGESAVSRILELVQNASSRKTETERFITRFSRVYTPAVVLLAVLIMILPPLISGSDQWAQWFHRGLVFLVISCPCALVISIPLGFFAGIGSASRNGILIKGSQYVEALNKVHTIAFDKTGTLTEGAFTLHQIQPADGFTEAQLLEAAAYAESNSTHPIAKSILKAYGKPIVLERIGAIIELPGKGIRAEIDGHEILIGNARLISDDSVVLSKQQDAGSWTYLKIDGQFAGSMLIADRIKKDSAQAIEDLKKLGIKVIALISGDRSQTAEEVGRTLGIDRVYSELLPDHKVDVVEELLSQKPANSTLVYVGDGINDAPVLARADVGVAMGKFGSDAAIEAADVVIISDEPSRLPIMIHIARRTNQIVRQNIVFSIGFKVLMMLLGTMGYVTMWIAVFADVGVMLLAVLNSLRVLGAPRTAR